MAYSYVQHALRDLLHGHREVVLRAGLDERRRIVVEGALAELVVVVVDLPGTLRGHDDQRIARVNVLEQIVYAGMNHRFGMVAAGTADRRTRAESSLTARSRSSFSTTWSKRSATVELLAARRAAARSISPELSVARSRSRRSSSSIGAVTKIVTPPGMRSATLQRALGLELEHGDLPLLADAVDLGEKRAGALAPREDVVLEEVVVREPPVELLVA